MNEKPQAKQSASNITSDSSVQLYVTELRATVAETYCTKDEAQQHKADVNQRVNDVHKTIWHIVVPLIGGLFGLIGWIFYLIITKIG